MFPIFPGTIPANLIRASANPLNLGFYSRICRNLLTRRSTRSCVAGPLARQAPYKVFVKSAVIRSNPIIGQLTLRCDVLVKAS